MINVGCTYQNLTKNNIEIKYGRSTDCLAQRNATLSSCIMHHAWRIAHGAWRMTPHLVLARLLVLQLRLGNAITGMRARLVQYLRSSAACAIPTQTSTWVMIYFGSRAKKGIISNVIFVNLGVKKEENLTFLTDLKFQSCRGVLPQQSKEITPISSSTSRHDVHKSWDACMEDACYKI